MMHIKCKLRQLRYDVRYLTMRYPLIYFPLTYLGDKGGLIVNKHTDIVIEGFPRSANTFAVNAFRLAQNKQVNIAHHKHSIAQIIKAVNLKIPILFLIRDPHDAVSSFLVREPCLLIQKALYYYIIFHRYLLSYKDNLVIASFETITNNYGKVIQEINLKFNTDFQLFDHSSNNIKKCFQGMEKYSQKKSRDGKIIETNIPRPSAVRKEAINNIKNRISQPEYKAILNQAYQVYYLFLKSSI